MQINNVEDLKKVMEAAFPSLTWELRDSRSVRVTGTMQVVVTAHDFGDYSVSLTCGRFAEVSMGLVGKHPVEILKRVQLGALQRLSEVKLLLESIGGNNDY